MKITKFLWKELALLEDIVAERVKSIQHPIQYRQHILRPAETTKLKV